jgi:hypothetical protein
MENDWREFGKCCGEKKESENCKTYEGMCKRVWEAGCDSVENEEGKKECNEYEKYCGYMCDGGAGWDKCPSNTMLIIIIVVVVVVVVGGVVTALLVYFLWYKPKKEKEGKVADGQDKAGPSEGAPPDSGHHP